MAPRLRRGRRVARGGARAMIRGLGSKAYEKFLEKSSKYEFRQEKQLTQPDAWTMTDSAPEGDDG